MADAWMVALSSAQVVGALLLSTHVPLEQLRQNFDLDSYVDFRLHRYYGFSSEYNAAVIVFVVMNPIFGHCRRLLLRESMRQLQLTVLCCPVFDNAPTIPPLVEELHPVPPREQAFLAPDCSWLAATTTEEGWRTSNIGAAVSDVVDELYSDVAAGIDDAASDVIHKLCNDVADGEAASDVLEEVCSDVADGGPVYDVVDEVCSDVADGGPVYNVLEEVCSDVADGGSRSSSTSAAISIVLEDVCSDAAEDRSGMVDGIVEEVCREADESRHTATVDDVMEEVCREVDESRRNPTVDVVMEEVCREAEESESIPTVAREITETSRNNLNDSGNNDLMTSTRTNFDGYDGGEGDQPHHLQRHPDDGDDTIAIMSDSEDKNAVVDEKVGELTSETAAHGGEGDQPHHLQRHPDDVSYTHLDVYKRQEGDQPHHLQRHPDDGDDTIAIMSDSEDNFVRFSTDLEGNAVVDEVVGELTSETATHGGEGDQPHHLQRHPDDGDGTIDIMSDSEDNAVVDEVVGQLTSETATLDLSFSDTEQDVVDEVVRQLAIEAGEAWDQTRTGFSNNEQLAHGKPPRYWSIVPPLGGGDPFHLELAGLSSTQDSLAGYRTQAGGRPEGQLEVGKQHGKEGSVDITKTQSAVVVPGLNSPMMGFDHALYVTTARMLTAPRSTVNARIVIVGCSDTAIALLKRMIFCRDVRFTGLLLLSPNGLTQQLASYKLMVQGRGVFRPSSQLSRLGVDCQIRILPTFMSGIDREAKMLKIGNDTYLSYDSLVLTPGLETSARLKYFRSRHGLGKVGGMMGLEELAMKAWKWKRLMPNKHGDLLKPAIVYGATLDALSAIRILLSLGIPGTDIVWVVPQLEGPGMDKWGPPRPPWLQDLELVRLILDALQHEEVTAKWGIRLADITHSDTLPPGNSEESRGAAVAGTQGGAAEGPYAGFEHWITAVSFDRIQGSGAAAASASSQNRDIVALRDRAEKAPLSSDGISFQKRVSLSKFSKKKSTKVVIPCKCFVLCDGKDLDPEIFLPLNSSGLVYDGRLVVNGGFATNDPDVYGGGAACKFTRKYGICPRMECHNSLEVGDKLGNNLIQTLSRSLTIRCQSFSVLGPFHGPVSTVPGIGMVQEEETVGELERPQDRDRDRDRDWDRDRDRDQDQLQQEDSQPSDSVPPDGEEGEKMITAATTRMDKKWHGKSNNPHTTFGLVSSSKERRNSDATAMPKSGKPPLPRLSSPKSMVAKLPGGLQFVHVATPHWYAFPEVQEMSAKRKRIISRNVGGLGGEVFVLEMDPDDIIVRWVYCGRRKVDAWKIERIVGRPVWQFGELKSRLEKKANFDLLGFLNQAWMSLFYHDKFQHLYLSIRDLVAVHNDLRRRTSLETTEAGSELDPVVPKRYRRRASLTTRFRVNLEGKVHSKEAGNTEDILPSGAVVSTSLAGRQEDIEKDGKSQVLQTNQQREKEGNFFDMVEACMVDFLNKYRSEISGLLTVRLRPRPTTS
ncbi:hypothetical protein CBR_g4083 [Chara braunii]|uniref:CFAP61 dimerisation domain-containing protein n=1 Tax=Chara braunii TaxID=69332 RepID=A0A388KH49_CHABU|nr:hypothetical protein CBR_g4083 [Chara braunii]|eukprot:GBG69390.1 hypothetical protein CBR_g4083 [Chara braunii]